MRIFKALIRKMASGGSIADATILGSDRKLALLQPAGFVSNPSDSWVIACPFGETGECVSINAIFQTKSIDKGGVMLFNDKVSVALSPDGDCETKNNNGVITLDKNGRITLKSTTASVVLEGNKITLTGDVSINGIDFATHIHTSGQAGSPTSPPLPQE